MFEAFKEAVQDQLIKRYFTTSLICQREEIKTKID